MQGVRSKTPEEEQIFKNHVEWLSKIEKRGKGFGNEWYLFSEGYPELMERSCPYPVGSFFRDENFDETLSQVVKTISNITHHIVGQLVSNLKDRRNLEFRKSSEDSDEEDDTNNPDILYLDKDVMNLVIANHRPESDYGVLTVSAALRFFAYAIPFYLSYYLDNLESLKVAESGLLLLDKTDLPMEALSLGRELLSMSALSTKEARSEVMLRDESSVEKIRRSSGLVILAKRVKDEFKGFSDMECESLLSNCLHALKGMYLSDVMRCKKQGISLDQYLVPKHKVWWEMFVEALEVERKAQSRTAKSPFMKSVLFRPVPWLRGFLSQYENKGFYVHAVFGRNDDDVPVLVSGEESGPGIELKDPFPYGLDSGKTAKMQIAAFKDLKKRMSESKEVKGGVQEQTTSSKTVIKEEVMASSPPRYSKSLSRVDVDVTRPIKYQFEKDDMMGLLDVADAEDPEFPSRKRAPSETVVLVDSDSSVQSVRHVPSSMPVVKVKTPIVSVGAPYVNPLPLVAVPVPVATSAFGGYYAGHDDFDIPVVTPVVTVQPFENEDSNKSDATFDDPKVEEMKKRRKMKKDKKDATKPSLNTCMRCGGKKHI